MATTQHVWSLIHYNLQDTWGEIFQQKAEVTALIKRKIKESHFWFYFLIYFWCFFASKVDQTLELERLLWQTEKCLVDESMDESFFASLRISDHTR